MKAYSQDLREKVLRAVDQGFPRGEVVKLMGVSRATIKRYLRAAARDRPAHDRRVDALVVWSGAGRAPLAARCLQTLRLRDGRTL